MPSPRPDPKTMYLASVKNFNAAKELETLAKKLEEYARHEKYKTHELAKSLKRYADSQGKGRRRRTMRRRRPLRHIKVSKMLGRKRRRPIHTIKLRRSPHKIARSKTRRVCGHRKK
jgi:hypothetical protein